MCIVFVSRRYWPAVGGAESYLRDVSRELAQRHAVKVLAERIDDRPATRLSDVGLEPLPRFEAFTDGKVEVQQLRIPTFRKALLSPLVLHAAPGFRRFSYGPPRRAVTAVYVAIVSPVIKSHLDSADVVHMWGGDLIGAAAVRAANACGAPVAITPFAHEGQWGDDPTSALTYRSADRVLALQRPDAELYRRLGVAPERLAIVGATGAQMTPGGGPELRRRHSVDGPLILFLGARRPYKGADVLVSAAELVTASRPDVTFAFVGPGEPLPKTGSSARLLDIGAVESAEVSGWLDAADLLCLPSAGETFGRVIAEAWSLRTPVLTSDLPSLRELVESAGGGLTVPRDPHSFAAAIRDLLTDPQRLAAMGRAGHRYWSENLTVEAVAQRHEVVYQSLVDAKVPDLVP